MDLKDDRRKSEMQIGEVYFWTNTIYEWKHILSENSIKDIIISSLQNLSERKLIEVYGFVIMPNHIHLVWQLNKMNGKEKPNASFQKFTAQSIGDNIKYFPDYNYLSHKVDEHDRAFRVWQRDPLATLLENEEIIEAKLNYIHNNPLQEHWSLITKPEDYRYSSARYYEKGEKEWSFIKHYKDRVCGS